MQKQGRPSSPDRTQEEQSYDHIHWDPGGVKSFHGTIPPDEHPPGWKHVHTKTSSYQKQNDVYTFDKNQSKVSVGLNDKSDN